MHHVDRVILELQTRGVDDNLFFYVRVALRRVFKNTVYLKDYATHTTQYSYYAVNGIAALYHVLRENPRTLWEYGPILPREHSVLVGRVF